MSGSQCHYIGHSGTQCREVSADGGGLCFWHSPDAPRNDPDLKKHLEAWIRAGNLLEGISLRYANLEGLIIGNLQRTEVVNLQGADFYRANLKDAHLFAANFSGASLMKADLSGATLVHACMKDTNLLGTKFGNAQLSLVKWGDLILQEKLGSEVLARRGWQEATQYFYEAGEVYRGLYIACQSKGLKEEASRFYIKLQHMHQRMLKPYSWNWGLSKLVDWTCGYGERPVRVIGFSIGIILLWTCFYSLGGVMSEEGWVQWKTQASVATNLNQLVTCFYYSVVTFTTLGYGDIVPHGWVRLLAAAQAFIGAFSTALFVVVFAKKTLR
jgi:hypothetical protein